MSSDEDFLGARLGLSLPLRSTSNGTVPGLLCKGCSQKTPPLREAQKPSRQAKAACGGGMDACLRLPKKKSLLSTKGHEERSPPGKGFGSWLRWTISPPGKAMSSAAAGSRPQGLARLGPPGSTGSALSLGPAVTVPADVVAACKVVLKLSDPHKEKDAGGTPALPGANHSAL